MTITTAPPSAPPVTPVTPSMRLTSGRLPTWAPWAVLAGSAVVSLIFFGVLAMAS
jgi:phosphate transport system permease protein